MKNILSDLSNNHHVVGFQKEFVIFIQQIHWQSLPSCIMSTKTNLLPLQYKDLIPKCLKINSDMAVILWTDKDALGIYKSRTVFLGSKFHIQLRSIFLGPFSNVHGAVQTIQRSRWNILMLSDILFCIILAVRITNFAIEIFACVYERFCLQVYIWTWMWHVKNL